MATEAQIDANRRNAQRSTGPRTAAGKAAAAGNATRHGLFCRDLLLRGERAADLQALARNLDARLRPTDALERVYAQRVLAAAWKLRRIARAEAVALENDMEACPSLKLADDPLAQHLVDSIGHIERMQKYAGSLERSMDRAMAQLKKLQAQRGEPSAFDAPADEEPNCENEANRPAPEHPVDALERGHVVHSCINDTARVENPCHVQADEGSVIEESVIEEGAIDENEANPNDVDQHEVDCSEANRNEADRNEADCPGGEPHPALTPGSDADGRVPAPVLRSGCLIARGRPSGE